ncbi:MAG: hypothetical protein JWO73_294 [Candidatus Taylorbacteria bacterium]|nr:hypothetical protein [Candidatus Taylorbacteria bacterium]
MNNLYLIGGSPRSGKTIIFKEMINRKPMIAISSDALRESARYTLTEEPFVSIQKLSFEGDVSFHRAGENKDISHAKHFSYDIDQEELTWKAIVGLINFYDRKSGNSLIIEGMAITPERVKSLSLKNLKIKAAFVGFTDDSHLKNILEYAHANEDWVHKKITLEDGGDDSSVRKWFNEELGKNKEDATLAKEYGYEFFSPHEGSFEEYTNKVVEYLLG